MKKYAIINDMDDNLSEIEWVLPHDMESVVAYDANNFVSVDLIFTEDVILFCSMVADLSEVDTHDNETLGSLLEAVKEQVTDSNYTQAVIDFHYAEHGVSKEPSPMDAGCDKYHEWKDEQIQ